MAIDMKGMGDKVLDPLKSAGEAMKGAGQKAAQNSTALSLAVIEHAEANTREAFAALRAAASAGSFADILKVQGDYVREQSQRGMNQAREIGEMIAKFGRETAQGFTGSGDKKED